MICRSFFMVACFVGQLGIFPIGEMGESILAKVLCLGTQIQRKNPLLNRPMQPNFPFAPCRDINASKCLDLTESYINDDDMAGLGQFPDLEQLYLCQTSISANGLRHAQGLKKLMTLNLALTKVGNQGLKQIERLTSLEELTLTCTNIDDRGLEHLTRLKKLSSLCLTSTDITDVGLLILSKMPNLRIIYVTDTLVTTEGIKRFNIIRPDVEVTMYFTRAKEKKGK
jgi:hypothetical protein